MGTRMLGGRKLNSREGQNSLHTHTLLASTWLASLLLILVFFSSTASAEEITNSGIRSPPTDDNNKITAFRSGDLLLFESWPLATSLALYKETIDLSLLYNIQNQIDNVTRHAHDIAYNQMVPFSEAANHCPRGYPGTISDALNPKYRQPQYIDAYESQNSPDKTYNVFTFHYPRRRH